ncbi:MAG: PIG-L family deacetylase [Anaerolineae bacterium]|nr:PIG-L family deacetylase [Anaerolineae bacterium]
MIPLEQSLADKKTILIVVAHPDDIEFGMGGSVARWTDEGHRVIFCIVTNGAAGSNDPNTDWDALIVTRQAEQRRAADILGVEDVRFLNYADGTLEPTLGLRRDLTRIVRELRPYRVVIMDPTAILIQGEQFDYINHPDHRASGEAALYAVFPSAESRPIFPELLDEGYEPHHVEELYLGLSQNPNIAVDITGYTERKIKALLSHESQVDASVGDMVRGWDTEGGKQAGVDQAEVFRVMRFPTEQPKTEEPVGAHEQPNG